jgi:trans-aconitate 2-methyltransferase
VTSSPKLRDWDAATYAQVARPQESWAKEVLERLPLDGDETVLDAGCGTGNVTRMLAERLPNGRVIGVDGSPAMTAKAREVLGDDVELITCDLLDLELDEPVDAVFSNATFHWITDHERLFERLFRSLRPGGRLVAQCGGKGNVARVKRAGAEVGAEPPFDRYFEDWDQPWRFADAEETQALLEGAGFTQVRCWLEDPPAHIPPDEANAFLATVCLGSHLDSLPDGLRADFVREVRERLPEPDTLIVEYVRLNMDARRP